MLRASPLYLDSCYLDDPSLSECQDSETGRGGAVPGGETLSGTQPFSESNPFFKSAGPFRPGLGSILSSAEPTFPA